MRTNRTNAAVAGASLEEGTPREALVGTPVARTVKISERIAAALVSDIVAAGLAPGDRLSNEASMLARFQVGRASLREALRILEVHGLINLRSGPGGGPIVTAVDPHNVARTFSLYLQISRARIRELVEARMFIEPMVARMAAQNRDPEAQERLRQAMAEEASVPDGDEDAYVEAANNFHYAVTTMTGNTVVDLVATAMKELYTTRFVSAGLASRTTERVTMCEEHREIGEAILAGDADAAERLMREHMAIYAERVAASSALTDELITWG